jgi:Fe-Mn family superoxide dismutase
MLKIITSDFVIRNMNKQGLRMLMKKKVNMERRKFFKAAGLIAAASYVSRDVFAKMPEPQKADVIEGVPAAEFPPLPFAYDALEPYIDARTMELHYDKHHRAYYTNFINAIKGTGLEGKPMSEVFSTISKQTDAVRNNGGGYYNHLFFWKNLGKGSSGPSAELAAAINESFGSVDKFKEAFNNAAKSRFGSGWAWLYIGSDKNLAVTSSPNQDNMLMDLSTVKGKPLLTLDVWEHAYYLKYQNRRPEYIDAFWNVVNWDEVNKRFTAAK